MHVIYVTGLGDTKKRGQRTAVALWRLHGVTPHFFESDWSNVDETFEHKFARLIALIDRVSMGGKRVSIVGVSAGASITLHAYAAKRKQLHGVVCVSGKIHHPEKMHSRIMEHNPAFGESMHGLPRSLSALSEADRQRILTVYSDGDRTVRMEDSRLDHAHMRLVGHGNHAITIAQQITFGAWRLFRFLRQLP